MSGLLAKTFRSSTFKQALMFIGIFGAVVIALFGYVYWSTAYYVRSRSDNALLSELAILQEAYTGGGRDAVISKIAQRIADDHFKDRVYLLANSAFAPLAGNLQAWPSVVKGANGWADFSTQQREHDALRKRPLRATFETLQDGTHLLVGRDVEDLDEFEGKIRLALVLSISLIFVIAGAVSVSVTRRTVGRIESINATSRAIMQSGLGRRIPLRGTRDEWDELAANLNSMLARIEALMGEVKQYTDNVAHDLRTPLSRIRGRLEKAGRHEGSSVETLIGDTIADLDDVLGMFSSLTRISQIEANDRTAGFHMIDLAAIAREVVELFDATAEDEGVQLDVTGDPSVPVNGDRDLLFDAISNLVDNAIKHGREAGRVTLEISSRDDGAVISVSDDGPGIPTNEHQQVFKRFYRLERSRGTTGNGLGLSLVAAVARLHGANIEVLDKKPGLELRLCFPQTP